MFYTLFFSYRTHTIKALLADAIDLLNYIVSQDFFKDISKKIEINLKKIYNYIAEQIKSFKCAMSRGSDKLFSQIDLALIDFFKMLNKLTDQPMNDDASKPRSVKEYVDSKKCLIFCVNTQLTACFTFSDV